MDTARYEMMDHTADLAVRVHGDTLADLFSNSGYALFDNLCHLPSVRELEATEILVRAPALDDLLHGFLSELLQTFAIKHYLFTRFEVLSVNETEIVARAHGEPYDAARHGLLGEIKAVTYHDLAVIMAPDGWEARVIFDV